MVLPETPGIPDPTRSENPRLRLIGIVGAAILTLAAISVLGNLTSVDPESAEPTVTTTSTLVATSSTFGVVEVGVPIDLEPLIALDAPAFAIVELDDRILIFSRGPGGFGATLTIYDGESETAPPIMVIEGSYVDDIIPTGDGLLAYGHQLHPHRATAWRSPDGLTWSAEVLPMGQADGIPVMLNDAISNDDMLVITGLASPLYGGVTLNHQVRARLIERFGGFVEWFNWETTPDGDVVFNVIGPLGIHVGVALASELGLDPEPFKTVNEGLGPDTPDFRSLTWVKVPGGSWDVSMTESPIGPYQMFLGRDGWVWSTNLFDSGLLATPDGSTWIRVPSNEVMADVRNWGRRYSGRSSEGVLMTSPDAINWRELDLTELINQTDEWHLHEFESAEGGFAVMAVQYADTIEPADVPIKSEGELELFLSEPYLVVRESGTEILRVPTGPYPPPSVVFDFEAGTLDIALDDDQVLMTVTLQELRKFEATDERLPLASQYLLFSVDGVAWTVQNLGRLPGVTGIEIFGGGLFIRMHSEGHHFLLRGDLP